MVVVGAVAGLQLPIWAVLIGDSQKIQEFVKRRYKSYSSTGGLIQDQRRGHRIC